MILITIYPAGAKNTDSWRCRKADLQCVFPLNVLMVPSSVFITTTGGVRLPHDVSSLSETIRFGSL
jgi:hypothetical protein